MAAFMKSGNVWVVTIHYYDDGEHTYETKVCKDYETAKAIYESILDETNRGDRRLKGFKENPDDFNGEEELATEDRLYFFIQTMEWDYYLEVNAIKEDILSVCNEIE